MAITGINNSSYTYIVHRMRRELPVILTDIIQQLKRLQERRIR